MNEILSNMIRGLALHYLHQGTVEEAIEQGKVGDVPAELLESLPGMMFEITSAASAVFSGERTFDEVVDELVEMVLASRRTEDFNKDDAATLVKLTIEFFRELSGNDAGESPLPPMKDPWYQYGIKVWPTSESS
jgi:hypothetical protein